MSDNDAQNKINEEILADARTKAERALRSARREAEKITKKAQDDAEQIEQEVINHARGRAEAQAKIIQTATEPARRRIKLDVREEVLLSVISDAKVRLLNRDSDDYGRTLTALTAEAAELLQDEGLTAYLSSEDYDKFGAALPGRLLGLTLEVRPASQPLEGGVIVETADGRRRVDNSIEARLERIYPELRREIAQTLFGDDE
jgi:vacuolar-type H+-ATPase subunit E/Vma4